MAIDVRIRPEKGKEWVFEMLKGMLYNDFILLHMNTHAKSGEFNTSIKDYIDGHPLMWMKDGGYFFIFAHFDMEHAKATRRDLRKAANRLGLKVRIEISV